MIAVMQSMVAHLSATPPAPPAVVVRQPEAGARNPWAKPLWPQPQSPSAGTVDRWVEAQGRQLGAVAARGRSLERLPQEGAGTAGARVDYAASVASSRPGNSLHRALTKLQRAISEITGSDAELKGERQISMESKNMTECA